MIDSSCNDHSLLAKRTTLIISQCLKISLATWQDEEIRSDGLESTKIFICNTEDFVGLVRLDKLCCKLLHLKRCNRLRKGDDEVVVETLDAVLGYLFEVLDSGLNQVDDRQIWYTLTRCINVCLQEDVAISQSANIHDRCDNILTIRVKNERFKCKQGSRNEASIANLYFLLLIREITCLAVPTLFE